MFTCPLGHLSTADDFCDRCGRPIGRTGSDPSVAETSSGGVSGTVSVTHLPLPGAPLGGVGAAEALCWRCETPLSGRFCEYCGQDSLVPGPRPDILPDATSEQQAPVRPVTGAEISADQPDQPDQPGQPDQPDRPDQAWFVMVTADRSYFDTIQALEGPDSTTISFPEDYVEQHFPLCGDQVLIGRRLTGEGIDLIGPGEDYGVSHRHARFLAQPGGSWAVEDLGSTNGTRVNNHSTLLEAHTRVPLAPGDRLYVGAWTRLTLRHSEADPQS